MILQMEASMAFDSVRKLVLVSDEEKLERLRFQKIIPEFLSLAFWIFLEWDDSNQE